MPSLDQVLPWFEMRARKHACFLRALDTRVGAGGKQPPPQSLGTAWYRIPGLQSTCRVRRINAREPEGEQDEFQDMDAHHRWHSALVSTLLRGPVRSRHNVGVRRVPEGT